MSLQTLKRKTEAIENAPVNIVNGFYINGGPRTLSYVGRSMKNSSVKTPFRGINPMGFNGDTGIASANSTVFAFPNIKSELNQAIDEHQISVKNTRSLIDTKYKWIHGGTTPNVWVQPHNNLESSERTKSLRVKTITGQCCNNYNDHYNEASIAKKYESLQR